MDDGFEQVIGQYAPMLMAYLYAIVRDRHLAEDLLQETFLSLYRQRSQSRDVHNLHAWLRTVARNHAFRALRRSNSSRLTPWEQADDSLFRSADESNADAAALLEHLRQCRAALPEQQRRIIELFYDQHRSGEQIAGQLGLADKTVWQTLWLARRNLRECLRRRVQREQ